MAPAGGIVAPPRDHPAAGAGQDADEAAGGRFQFQGGADEDGGEDVDRFAAAVGQIAKAAASSHPDGWGGDGTGDAHRQTPGGGSVTAAMVELVGFERFSRG
jgi:hypothetical protein